MNPLFPLQVDSDTTPVVCGLDSIECGVDLAQSPDRGISRILTSVHTVLPLALSSEHVGVRARTRGVSS